MKTVRIELDDETAARLERVAPGRSRRRSEFIRRAIRQALWEVEKAATAEAYRRPSDSAAAYLDPGVWQRPRRGAKTHRRSRR